MGFSVKATLNDGTTIFNNFYQNRFSIKKLKVYWTRYWYKDPNGLLFNTPFFTKKWKWNGTTIIPEFVSKEVVEYDYDVDPKKYVPIVQMRAITYAKSGVNRILGVRLFLDKLYVFDDIENRMWEEERPDGWS